MKSAGKAIRIGIVVILGIVALGLLYVFLTLNSKIKSAVEYIGPQVLGASVKIEKVNFSPFKGAGEIIGMEVGNPEGFHTDRAFKMDRVQVALEPMSVFKDKIIIHAIVIEGPEVTFEGSLRGSNIKKLEENANGFAAGMMGPGGESAGGSEPAASSGGGPKIQIDKFQMVDGKIRVSAKFLKGKTLSMPLPMVDVSNLGQGPEGATVGEVVQAIMKVIKDNVLVAVKGSGKFMKGMGKSGAELLKQGRGTLKGKGSRFLNKLKGKK